jgi:hypothetical protein
MRRLFASSEPSPQLKRDYVHIPVAERDTQRAVVGAAGTRKVLVLGVARAPETYPAWRFPTLIIRNLPVGKWPKVALPDRANPLRGCEWICVVARWQ